MERIKSKYENLSKALESFKKSITQYQKTAKLTKCTDTCYTIFENQKEMERTIRDSMIQRFEFCTDCLWKFFKVYLEGIEKIQEETGSPRKIFKLLCKIQFLTEAQTAEALRMMESRNITSHIYKEEIAEILSKRIPSYYNLMIEMFKNASISLN